MTQKQKDEVQVKPHGYYECYYSAGGGLEQAMSKTGDEVEPTAAAGSCNFTVPRRNNSVFMVTVIYPSINGENGPVMFRDEYINEESIRIIPPSGAGSAILTTSQERREIERPQENDNDLTYDNVRNSLLITNPNSNAVSNGCGTPGGGGAVIINW